MQVSSAGRYMCDAFKINYVNFKFYSSPFKTPFTIPAMNLREGGMKVTQILVGSQQPSRLSVPLNTFFSSKVKRYFNVWRLCQTLFYG